MKVKQILIAVAIIIFGIIIDQFTKFLSFKNFELSRNYKCLPGLFRFSLVRNEGGAWGIFSGKLWFLIIITIVAMGFFVYLAKFVDFKENAIFSAAYVLIVSGTLGNFIDRIILGYVRDFVTFDFISFPSFNFADMCLTFGVILLCFDIIFGESGKKWG
ncbi:MAG: signal peptidase II [Acholeplasmataceae bacterium]|nr:signal peptidase II [Acholeplasmataceae bacterium]